MGEEDLRSDIKELRAQNNIILTELSRISATLGERCGARLDLINELKKDSETHGKHIKALQMHRAHDLGYASGAGAVMGAVIVGLYHFFFGGTH